MINYEVRMVLASMHIAQHDTQSRLKRLFKGYGCFKPAGSQNDKIAKQSNMRLFSLMRYLSAIKQLLKYQNFEFGKRTIMRQSPETFQGPPTRHNKNKHCQRSPPYQPLLATSNRCSERSPSWGFLPWGGAGVDDTPALEKKKA